MACHKDYSINPYLDISSIQPQSGKLVSGSYCDDYHGSCEHDMSQYVPLAEHIGLKNELHTLRFQLAHPDESLLNYQENEVQRDSIDEPPQKGNRQNSEERYSDTNEEIVFLKMDKLNLELEIRRLNNIIDSPNNNTNKNLERELESSREREKDLGITVYERNQQIRELTTKIQARPDDTAGKEEMIKVLLRENESLHFSLEQLQQRLSSHRQLEDLYSELTRKLNGADNLIRELQLTNTNQRDEIKTHLTNSHKYTNLLYDFYQIESKLDRSQQFVKDLENQLAIVSTGNDANLNRVIQDMLGEQETLQKKYQQKCDEAAKFEKDATETNRTLARIKNNMPYGMDSSYQLYNYGTPPNLLYPGYSPQAPDHGVSSPP